MAKTILNFHKQGQQVSKKLFLITKRNFPFIIQMNLPITFFTVTQANMKITIVMI